MFTKKNVKLINYSTHRAVPIIKYMPPKNKELLIVKQNVIVRKKETKAYRKYSMGSYTCVIIIKIV